MTRWATCLPAEFHHLSTIAPHHASVPSTYSCCCWVPRVWHLRSCLYLSWYLWDREIERSKAHDLCKSTWTQADGEGLNCSLLKLVAGAYDAICSVKHPFSCYFCLFLQCVIKCYSYYEAQWLHCFFFPSSLLWLLIKLYVGYNYLKCKMQNWLQGNHHSRQCFVSSVLNHNISSRVH